MEMKITQRDKWLLAFLAAILIVVGAGAFVILPGLDKTQELMDQREDMENQKADMEMQIASLPQEKKALEDAQVRFAELSSQFYPVMSSQEIDRMLTSTVLDCGLMAVDMNIEMSQEGMRILPYQASEYWQTVVNGMEKESESEDWQPGEKDFPQVSNMYAAKVTLTTVGEKAKVENLIDQWNKEKSPIRVTEFTMTPEKADKEKTGNYQLNISLEIYLYGNTQQ